MATKATPWTDKQGQYLAYIATYLLLHRYPPAERDIQNFFRVSPPTVHAMLQALQARGLIHKEHRQPRSIRLMVDSELLPKLLPHN
jgi:Mn-dependent DtxR family transcriptional regulator